MEEPNTRQRRSGSLHSPSFCEGHLETQIYTANGIHSRFLLSTHYTHYDPWLFTMNVSALVALLIPRLPQVTVVPSETNSLINKLFQLHRHRVRFLAEEQYHSGMSTPVETTFAASGSTTPVDGRTVPVTFKESHFN
jgi:hypothetical protein